MDEESGAPDGDTGQGQEASSSGQASGVNLAAYTRGAWKGSNVNQVEINWLYRSRRIPEEVSCRIPEGELEPVHELGKFVVFAAHFERGFGLPASDFSAGSLTSTSFNGTIFPATLFFIFLLTFLLWKPSSPPSLLSILLLASTIFGSTRSRIRSFRTQTHSSVRGVYPYALPGEPLLQILRLRILPLMATNFLLC
jgi:hypothetical protein